jgi:hypothetical protein
VWASAACVHEAVATAEESRQHCAERMGNRLQSLRNASLLLVAPVLCLFLHALFSEARGPFYLAVNYDPEYAYLFNGLNLISGAAPEHVDHPGIPLQIFAAACIKLANIGSATNATIATVVAHAEAYLKGLNSTLMACYLFAQLFLGAVVWKKTGSLAGALLLQATPFLLGDDFVETVRFRPELMILVLAFVMAATLYLGVLRENRESNGIICLLGFLAATGLVSKINFLPLILLPLFSLRTWRDRAVYIVSGSLFTGLWLLILIPQFHRITTWITALATRQGQYGTGDAGLFGAHYPQFLAQFVVARPIFFLLLALSLGAVVHTYGWRWNKAAPQEKRLARLLGGLVLAQFVVYLMAGKFGQERYLVPAVAFCGLNCVLLQGLGRHWEANAITRGRLRQACFALVILIACWSAISLRNLRPLVAKHRDQHAAMAQALEKYSTQETIVHYYGCSSLYHALWFGNTYSGRRYSRAIESQFPNHLPAYHVEEWPDKTYWTSVAPPHERLERRLERGETLLLAGQQWPWPKGREREFYRLVPTNVVLQMDPVRQQGDEAIYRVRASSLNRNAGGVGVP